MWLTVKNISASIGQRLPQFQVERTVRCCLPGIVYNKEELQDDDDCEDETAASRVHPLQDLADLIELGEFRKSNALAPHDNKAATFSYVQLCSDHAGTRPMLWASRRSTIIWLVYWSKPKIVILTRSWNETKIVNSESHSEQKTRDRQKTSQFAPSILTRARTGLQQHCRQESHRGISDG